MKNAGHSRVSASTSGVLLRCTFISSSGNDRRRIAFRCAYRAGVTRVRMARDTPEKQLGNDVDAAFQRAKRRAQASFRREKIIVVWRFSHFRRVDTRRRRERRMRAARRGIHGWNSGAPAAPRHDAIPRRI
ncbi:hypothetical protein [Burkholderia vietnamiensis]|uniref:hypothetical protein n=1 Tax=Burkholderia vietnamiensis TaxID=60552 RepID=UPI0012DB13CE|nr:hypothetical protein [Burkholderia vietnamiensis]